MIKIMNFIIKKMNQKDNFNRILKFKNVKQVKI